MLFFASLLNFMVCGFNLDLYISKPIWYLLIFVFINFTIGLWTLLIDVKDR